MTVYTLEYGSNLLQIQLDEKPTVQQIEQPNGFELSGQGYGHSISIRRASPARCSELLGNPKWSFRGPSISRSLALGLLLLLEHRTSSA
jgi:hypothetical protein